MKNPKSRYIIRIVIILLVFTVIIPFSILFYFLGQDAFKMIGYIGLVTILCLVFLPGYIMASLARSGAPVPIGKFCDDAYQIIKKGISQIFAKGRQ